LQFLADILDSQARGKLDHLVCFHLHGAHWTVVHHDFTGTTAQITRYNPLLRPRSGSAYEGKSNIDLNDQATLCAYLNDCQPLVNQKPRTKAKLFSSFGPSITDTSLDSPPQFTRHFNEEYLELQHGDSSTCGFWSIFGVFLKLLAIDLNRLVVQDMDRIPAELKEVVAPSYVAFHADPVGVPLDLVQQLFNKFEPTVNYSSLSALQVSWNPREHVQQQRLLGYKSEKSEDIRVLPGDEGKGFFPYPARCQTTI
jgi:hypothetical protein